MSETRESADIRLERYRYVLSQLQSLNEAQFRHVARYQAITTTVLSGGILLFVSWKGVEIDPVVAKRAIEALLCIQILTALFSVMSILSTSFSWIDYRKEECSLLVGLLERDPPNWRNLWRWHETYFLGYVILTTTAIIVCVSTSMLPFFK